MAIFTREDLVALIGPQTRPCVSIIMPTHRHHPGTEQDPIRFKNLLKTAETLLSQRYSPKEVRSLLGPLAERPGADFWQYQMDGLALFCSADRLAEYRVPMELPELAVVADSFHVKPLIRFLQTNERYFVLALSQKRVALYEGSRYALGPVNLAELPSSLTEALGIERTEQHLGIRTLGRSSAAPVFYGPGAPEDSRKEELARFFRAIDRSLWELLRDDPAPLILAGVEYYFPIYREVSRSSYLAAAGVNGNFDGATPEELHKRVAPVVSDIFQAREKEALDAYQTAHAKGLGIEDLAGVARFSIHGRVRRLLLADGAHEWGRLDRETGALTLTDAQQDTHDDDVLDDLAESVLARGGDVQVVAGPLPRGAVVAAILRW